MSGKIDLRKLPPLNALKGFEAATRRQSVREAADELCLTHPAVSYQIQLLEEDFGVALFAREGRSIVPTPEGRIFYGYARQALELLIQGAETIRGSRRERPLRVQTYVTASLRWLAPRIPAFSAAHPDIRLLLSTCTSDWQFDASLADVGLVYRDSAPGPEYCWVPLFDYRLFPVCSPQLRARLGGRPQPKDLLTLPLVTIYSEPRQWDLWFESAGVPYTPNSRLVVDTLALALEIALDGSAVALVNGPFVDRELSSGTLVRPLAHEAQCPGGWGLICRREVRDMPRVAAFIEFLAAQRTA